MIQKTYVMVKPEFANNNVVIENIKNRLEKSGLKIEKQGFIKYDTTSAKKHYHEHIGKDFYENLENYITSDKAYGMMVTGENAIATVRELAGTTKDPLVGTIRYDIPKMLGQERHITKNVIHSSDSEQASMLELSIFDELLKKGI